MAEANAEIIIPGRVHDFGWVMVPIRIGPLVLVDFVLDTSYRLFRISEGTHDLLQVFGLITPLAGRTWRIPGPPVGAGKLPDIDVRVSRVVSRLGLGIEAMLELNFLANFEEICFHRPSAMLTLRR